jgi:hypothetical protein
MSASCTIQLFARGAWRDVGSVSLMGADTQGWGRVMDKVCEMALAQQLTALR